MSVWPVDDHEDPVAGLTERVERLEARALLHRVIGYVLMLALAVVGIALYANDAHDRRIRTQFFCLLSAQAIVNAVPDDPLVVELAPYREALRCPPPPVGAPATP